MKLFPFHGHGMFLNLEEYRPQSEEEEPTYDTVWKGNKKHDVIEMIAFVRFCNKSINFQIWLYDKPLARV